MSPAVNPKELESWITELSLISGKDDRSRFLKGQPQLCNKEAFDKIYDAVISLTRVDVQRAQRLAEAGDWITSQLHDEFSSARSARAMGHVFFHSGKHSDAVREYDRAIAIFERLGSDLEVALTINGALHSLVYLGQYDYAHQLGEKARAIFAAHGDKLRLARLDTNMAIMFYRQDRFHEAAEMYDRAYQEFLQHGDAEDLAAILRNLAVCYISLNEFDRAERAYQQARELSEKHGFTRLVAEVDYNIAYLYYQRGEYLRAIELYDKTRVLCEELDDRYHRALCDLDQSEIYLELNLTEGGAEMARAAATSFQELGLQYEAAKAKAFFGIALNQHGSYELSLKLFDEARELFVKEKNHLWPTLIDLYKALVLYETVDDDLAHELASSALRYFDPSPLPAKAAVCELLLAAIELRFGETESARRYCSSALARLLHIESPAVYQAYFMLGQVEEASGNVELARQAYENAFQKLEGLRSSLGREELKIAFLKNKLAVYEGLVVTSLAVDKGKTRNSRTFEYIEQAKSKSLADLIAFRTSTLQSRKAENSAATAQLRDLRQKLNWVYHQIELEELNPNERSATRIQNLRRQGRQFEDALMKAFSSVQSVDQELAGLQVTETRSVAELQSKLPEDSILLEYYSARNWFYACLVTRDKVRIFPVAEVAEVREELRLLQLQIAKFRLGEEYIKPLEKMLLEATTAHLQRLNTLLIAPIRKYLSASHLIIVPHAFLHYLPFHALLNGDRALIDDFSISYAPSAGVFALCQEKPAAKSSEALVLAIPDQRAPHIREEAEYVAAALGHARLFIGDQASEEQLRAYGPQSRFIHIATHGYFRQDNPMFSSIRLGNSLLSLFDLYQLQLQAELVTLSGCGTGMNVVIGGDELIGLVRGLLYAGAQTLMVSLWEVHDESTAEFMREFYASYGRLPNKAMALRQAILNLRAKRPHPYFWGAFALVGKFS